MNGFCRLIVSSSLHCFVQAVQSMLQSHLPPHSSKRLSQRQGKMVLVMEERWLCRSASHASPGPFLQDPWVPLGFEIHQTCHAQKSLLSHGRWCCNPNSFLATLFQFCYWAYSATVQEWNSYLSSAPKNRPKGRSGPCVIWRTSAC